MIVRDEAAVIARCLESVRPIIDHWVVCDTGSVDDTPTIVADELRDLPGSLYHHDWVDFGHNRSALMEAAHGSADLLLLLDADMTVELRGRVDRLDPDVDAWLIRHAGDLSYAVPRLVRGDLPWRFEGATHEYLALDGDVRQRELETMVVRHHADGGSRADKFERDRRLLEAAVSDDPEDARSWFYLGQTLRDLGETDAAIDAYRRRTGLGGWDEELAYSWLQIGLLLERDDPTSALAALHEAWEARPVRPEALHALARLHRDAGRFHSALAMAELGLSLPPSEDQLFVHRDVERWGLRFERSIAAYWTGDVEGSLLDTDAVLAAGDVPEHVVDHAERNRAHCLDRLGDRTRPARPALAHLDALVPGATVARLEVPRTPAWPLCNPSIAEDPDEGFRATVRLVSYEMDDLGRYRSVDESRTIRTANAEIRLGASLEVTATAILTDTSLDVPAIPEAGVLGHEDIRLVHHEGRWWGLATVRDRTPDQRCQVALCEMQDGAIVRSRVLVGPEPGRHQKNWMPVVHSGELCAVHSCGPETIVVEIDTGAEGDTVPVNVVARHAAHPLLSTWRGGSPLVGEPVGTGRLAVVHDVIWVDGRRIYRHRLARFDSELCITHATPWWSFGGSDIEFAAGLAWKDDDLVVSYGIHDQAAAFAIVPAAPLLGLLRPVPAPLD